jgi:hypothetical protein
MLKKLLEVRDHALHRYSLDDSVKNLGLYNRAVKEINECIKQYDIEYDGIIDTLKDEMDSITHENIVREPIDLSDINEYNYNFEID